MLLVKKFLCCCPLDTGVVIIGNIIILLSFLSIYELHQRGGDSELITLNGVKSSTQACIEFTASIILIIVSFLVIIGAMKRQDKLIKIWLIVLAIYLILECVTILTAIFVPGFITLREPIVIEFIVTLIILSYFWYCVYLFHHELLNKVVFVV